MSVVRLISLLLLLAATVAGQQAVDFQETVRSAMAGSIEKQKASVQRQAASAQVTVAGSSSGFFTVAWPEPPHWKAVSSGMPVCDPMPRPELDKLVEDASQKEGLNAGLIQAVIGKESGARPCAVSVKGAQGLMQLMPATADELGVTDPFDPKQNIGAGAHLLKQLLTKYDGDVSLALGAYNAGSGRVDREGAVPQIPETLRYVSDIMNRFRIE